jgi:hypothetical protein
MRRALPRASGARARYARMCVCTCECAFMPHRRHENGAESQEQVSGTTWMRTGAMRETQLRGDPRQAQFMYTVNT